MFATPPLMRPPVFVSGLASVFALALAACTPTPTPAPIREATTSSLDVGDDPTIVAADALSTPAAGSSSPLVVLTVFTDFECPACPRLEAFMELVRMFWPDEVQVHYRHFPLSGSHPLAEAAGRAAAAAHRQGGYACMAEALYRTQKTWAGTDETKLRAHASELATACGLDAARLTQDMDDPRIAERVEADFRLGREVDVRGTPWVLVNGIRANLSPRDGLQPATLLKSLVRRELREAQAQMELGVPRADVPRARVFGNVGDADLARRLLD